MLLKPEEAMAELRCSRATLWKLLNSGEIDSMKMGNARRITRASLEQYVARKLAEAHGASGDARGAA
jgi:excisionase family DNA binding protein